MANVKQEVVDVQMVPEPIATTEFQLMMQTSIDEAAAFACQATLDLLAAAEATRQAANAALDAQMAVRKAFEIQSYNLLKDPNANKVKSPAEAGEEAVKATKEASLQVRVGWEQAYTASRRAVRKSEDSQAATRMAVMSSMVQSVMLPVFTNLDKLIEQNNKMRSTHDASNHDGRWARMEQALSDHKDLSAKKVKSLN